VRKLLSELVPEFPFSELPVPESAFAEFPFASLAELPAFASFFEALTLLSLSEAPVFAERPRPRLQAPLGLLPAPASAPGRARALSPSNHRRPRVRPRPPLRRRHPMPPRGWIHTWGSARATWHGFARGSDTRTSRFRRPGSAAPPRPGQKRWRLSGLRPEQ
jgi:hypothetical protein